jgi:uroporphyrinogen decarboxylase
VRTRADIDKLGVPDPETALRYVMDAVRLIRRELNERVPLIGFAGSPWTLACYMIEGGGSSSFARAKALAWNDPTTMHRLLDVVARSVSAYLIAQAKAGAQTLMVFDTWGGLLAPDMFRDFSLRYLAQIVQSIQSDIASRDVPVILFSKGANSHLEVLADTGCAGLGLDWTISLDEARRRVGSRVALQGNVDPAVLHADPETIRGEVKKALDSFGRHDGHVFNLGHGITPDVEPERLGVLIEAVHSLSARG